jgi:hypothetical protein
LKHSGLILVSVPNVANVTVRMGLLFGKFNYAERGILDRSHLRFYTRKTARRLLAAIGFEVVKEKMTVMPMELVLGLAPRGRIMKLISGVLAFFTAAMPGLLGYQTVLVARAKKADPKP